MISVKDRQDLLDRGLTLADIKYLVALLQKIQYNTPDASELGIVKVNKSPDSILIETSNLIPTNIGEALEIASAFLEIENRKINN